MFYHKHGLEMCLQAKSSPLPTFVIKFYWTNAWPFDYILLVDRVHATVVTNLRPSCLLLESWQERQVLVGTEKLLLFYFLIYFY